MCLVRLRYNCIHIGKAVKVGLLQFNVNIVNNVHIANVSIVKITKIAPSASIVYQFLVFFPEIFSFNFSIFVASKIYFSEKNYFKNGRESKNDGGEDEVDRGRGRRS